MSYASANGFLAASATAILSTAPGFRTVDGQLRNEGTTVETVELTVLATGGTARSIFKTTNLQPGQSIAVSNLVLGPTDTFKGATTTASTVSYRFYPSAGGPLTPTVITQQGAVLASGTPDARDVQVGSLTSSRQPDWTATGTSAVAGANSLEGTVGTSVALQGEAAQNTTKTGASLFETVLPPEYVAGSALSLVVSVQRNVTDGTTLTTTIDAEVWKMNDDGTNSVDLCTTSVITFTDTTAADKTFTIGGALLNPGDRLLIRLTGVATEGGDTGTVQTQINSWRFAAAA